MAERTPSSLVVKQGECNGCMSCQAFCATAREGYSARSSARIHIELDPWGGKHRLSVCRQCKEARCAEACPQNAIRLSDDGSYWFIDYELCNTCRTCVEACKLNGIWYDPLTRRVIKCDTCHGEPVCAQVCPMGALSKREG